MCDTGVGRVWRMGLLLLLLPIDMWYLLGPLEGPTKFKIGLVRLRWSTCIRDMWHGGEQFDEWVPSCCCSHWHVSLFTSPCALHSAFNGSDDSGLIAFDALQIHQVTSWVKRDVWHQDAILTTRHPLTLVVQGVEGNISYFKINILVYCKRGLAVMRCHIRIHCPLAQVGPGSKKPGDSKEI